MRRNQTPHAKLERIVAIVRPTQATPRNRTMLRAALRQIARRRLIVLPRGAHLPTGQLRTRTRRNPSMRIDRPRPLQLPAPSQSGRREQKKPPRRVLPNRSMSTGKPAPKRSVRLNRKELLHNVNPNRRNNTAHPSNTARPRSTARRRVKANLRGKTIRHTEGNSPLLL